MLTGVLFAMNGYQRFARRMTVVGIVLLAGGLIWSSRSSIKSTKLSIESAELTLVDHPCGDESDLTFNVTNPNSGTVRIVGIEGSCGQGCVHMSEMQPFQLESGQSKKVTMRFVAPTKTGPIKAPFVIYFAYKNTSLWQEMSFTGNAVESE